MPAAIRSVTDELDVATSDLSFPGAQAGVPTPTPLIRRVHNNKGGGGAVDPIIGLAFSGNARITGSGDDFKGDVTEILLTDSLQVRTVGGSDTVAWVVTDWFPLGRGSLFSLPTIPGDPGGAYVEVEFRLDLPASVEIQDTQLNVKFEELTAGVVPPSHLANVIPTGKGDSATSNVIDGADISPGAVAYDLDVPLTTWYSRGQGVFEQAADATFTLDATDGAGDPVAAGEAYISVLSRTEADGLVVTKGIKDTTPLTPADRPATPTDHAPHAWVEVDDVGTAVVTMAAAAAPQYFEAITAGLNLSIGPGRAFVDGADVRTWTETALGAQAINSTLDVYVLRDGSFSVVAEDAVVVGRPMRIYRIETDGVAITSVSDVRPIEGGGF